MTLHLGPQTLLQGGLDVHQVLEDARIKVILISGCVQQTHNLV